MDQPRLVVSPANASQLQCLGRDATTTLSWTQDLRYMGGASGLEMQQGCLKGQGLLLEEQEQLRRHRDQRPIRRYLTCGNTYTQTEAYSQQ